MNTQYIRLNMVPFGIKSTFHISQYDVGRTLGVYVYNGSEPVTLDNYTCTIEATRSDGTPIIVGVETANNIGTFSVTPVMSNKEDIYRAQFIIAKENVRIASIPFFIAVCRASMNENSEEIEEDATLFQQYTEAVQTAIADIGSDIQSEEEARQSADNTLQNNIDAEATARTNADNTLQNNIDAEATARQTADNTLQGNINSEALARASEDSNLQSQINQIIAPSGEAPSAAEIQNARIGADGVTYNSLGDAIRANDNELKSAIDVLSKIDYAFTLYKAVDATGAISNNNYMAITQRINCNTGDVIIRKVQNEDVNHKHLAVYVSEFTDDTFLRRTELIAYNAVLTIGINTNNIIISFGRYSSSGITITQTDINTYFSMGVYRPSYAKVDFENYLLEYSFEMRGNIIDLGYTSYAECIKPGIYTFSTANLANINDIPAGLNTGGILIVYVAGQVICQEIHTTFYEYIRYSATGTWMNKKKMIRVSYVATSGDDASTEGINVFIPRGVEGKSMRYNMGHCVDNSINADVWRLMYIYSLAAHQTSGTVINRKGEFECAVHLNGRSDFSGGYVHGDEVDQQVTFICDGKTVPANNVAGFYNEFKIVRNSILYDPADSTTPIANHGVEYTFTIDGLTIKQSVKWLVSDTLTNCFLAMFPILKTFSTYRFDDTNFQKVENNQSNYSITIPQAKSVTEFIDGLCSTMEITDYPTGLQGGDAVLVTDNSGLPYNKIYFIVCTGGTVTNGDLWKSTTKYSFC